MRDIIYTLDSKESRERVLRRLGPAETPADHEDLWSPKPRVLPDRMWLVHRGEIIGWMRVLGVETIEDSLVQSHRDGEVSNIMDATRLVTVGPLAAIEPTPHRGFRGFRYFDFDEYVGDKPDLVPVLCQKDVAVCSR